jgi:hypothetical protein
VAVVIGLEGEKALGFKSQHKSSAGSCAAKQAKANECHGFSLRAMKQSETRRNRAENTPAAWMGKIQAFIHSFAEYS